MSDTHPENSKNSTLLRLYWMVAWVFPSMVVISFVVDKKLGVAAYFLWPLIFLSMVAAKYFDIKFYNGFTADGEPATMQDFKKYCFYALPIIVALAALPYLILAMS